MFPRGNAVLWGDPVNRSCALNHGLLSWWLADSPGSGGGTWFDLFSKRHGVLTNSPTWTTGVRPGAFKALNLDGSDDYVAVSGSIVATSLTISCWAYITTRKANQGIVFSRGTNVTGINVSPAATRLGYTWNDDVNSWTWEGGPTIPASEWAFLCMSVAPTVAVAWVGTASSGLVSGTNSISHASTAIDSLRIGGDSFNQSSRSVVGKMNDIRIYNRALSQSDVAQLYVESCLGYPTALRLPR